MSYCCYCFGYIPINLMSVHGYTINRWVDVIGFITWPTKHPNNEPTCNASIIVNITDFVISVIVISQIIQLLLTVFYTWTHITKYKIPWWFDSIDTHRNIEANVLNEWLLFWQPFWKYENQTGPSASLYMQVWVLKHKYADTKDSNGLCVKKCVGT